MKIFAYIFSIYILTLTAIPCVDLPEENAMLKTVNISDSTTNHQNENDYCSPFCSCSCCVTPIIYQVFTVEFKCYPIVQAFHPEINSIFISSPCYTIWQPPKLS